MTPKILLLDDEKLLRETVREALTLAGFSVSAFGLALPALESAKVEHYDAAVLDVMVPDIDGFTIANMIKEEKPNLPIIFLTARDKTDDKLTGFEIGADDYLVKPFVMAELVARLNAVIGRSKNQKSAKAEGAFKNANEIDENGILQIADLKMNVFTREVLRGIEGSKSKKVKSIELTKTEFELLKLLMSESPGVVEKDSIMEELWDDGIADDYSLLDTYISHLRKKIDSEKGLPKLIHTKWGVGYYAGT
ncbi:MAG: response regulator transcription factor [Bifidobacteriaceae bacterium]|jgi:two-component system OmpR family response regulator|nr:response regulator transcription factor [Bifidobacteriaceae bacterium]